MSAELTLWWCGWDCPADVPEEHKRDTWPVEMSGWCTGGEAFGAYTTWVGAVWAVDADTAWLHVLRCYGDSQHRITARWEPKATDPAEPLSDRFPGGYPARPERNPS